MSYIILKIFQPMAIQKSQSRVVCARKDKNLERLEGYIHSNYHIKVHFTLHYALILIYEFSFVSVKLGIPGRNGSHLKWHKPKTLDDWESLEIMLLKRLRWCMIVRVVMHFFMVRVSIHLLKSRLGHSRTRFKNSKIKKTQFINSRFPND